jgi:hypothetical protein
VAREDVPNDTVGAPSATTTIEGARADSSSTPFEAANAARGPTPLPAPPEESPRADVVPHGAVSRTDRAALASDPSASHGIGEVLKHLQTAYERRDATLAKAVWPTVNERALARAFDGLRSQSVTFDRCQLNVSGVAGEVACRGVTSYVPRVGSQYQRTESRQWTFRVRKDTDSWVITSAAAR